MKKLITFIALILCIASVHADGNPATNRYVSGTNGIDINVYKTLTAYYASSGAGTQASPIVVSYIVAPDFDINTDVTVTPYGTAFTLSNFTLADAITSTGVAIQVTKTADGTIKYYQLIIKKIIKSSLPYGIHFGGAYPMNTTTTYNGWGYAVMGGTSTPQLTSTSQKFFLAFSPSAITDSLAFNIYASNNNAQTGLNIVVESSTDGSTWNTLTTFTSIALNSDVYTNRRKTLLLPINTQYVKFYYTAKGTDNINLNDFVVGDLPLSVSKTSITDLSYIGGAGPSPEQNFTLSALGLIGDITVTPPANFEISKTTETGFTTSPIVVTGSNGFLSGQTIFVRLAAGLSIANYSGNITLSSPGYTNSNVSLSGAVSITSILNITDKSDVYICPTANGVKISGKLANQTIEIFNILGKKLISTVGVDDENFIKLNSKGVHIIKVGNSAVKIVL